MIWPFGRNNRKGGDCLISTAYESTQHGVAPEMQDADAMGLRRKRSRQGRSVSQRGATVANKLQKGPDKKRTYSFSPGGDKIRVAKNAHHQHPVPPLPHGDAIKHRHTWDAAGVQQTLSTAGNVTMTENEQEWQRAPTLHKRKSNTMSRRKSSKRRKEDDDREAEIKAMSAFMPHPFDQLDGRPMKRDSKRMKDGLNRHLINPSSDISIPTAESMRSSMSSNSEKHASYQLKGLFSPHPTIRYADNPRFTPGASGFGSSDRSTRRKKLAERNPLSEETMKANKCIDDLADDLTASDIRELMERDKKRRERKQLADQLKMEQRLARRAEKQRAAAAEAARTGEPGPSNLERGVIGRELAGLGIVGMAESIKRRLSNASSKRKGKQAASLAPSDPFQDPVPKPQIARTESLVPTEGESPLSEDVDPIIETARIARLSRASISAPVSPELTTGHARGASNISEMMDLNKPTPALPILDAPDQEDRRPSDGSVRQPQSWRSFFKRSSVRKRASIPSSFSNTSRESALANPRPSQTYEIQRSTSNLPKRTMSKFREDLPESLMSPPDSRVQSPEVDELPPIHRGFPRPIGGEVDPGLRRHDTPTSGYRSHEMNPKFRNATPTSGYRSTDIPSPEPVVAASQSLASIDSEGSWLSGRPQGGSKRGSMQPHPLRNSASSLEKRYKAYAGSQEELGFAEDEYFSRMTPGADEMFEKSKNRTGDRSMAIGDEEDDTAIGSSTSNTKWGSLAKTPAVIRHDSRIKSREGLLTEFNADSWAEEDDEQLLTPTSPFGDNESMIDSPDNKVIHRAISISVPKSHARHVSVGSAKLLDVKPRASGDIRRPSVEN